MKTKAKLLSELIKTIGDQYVAAIEGFPMTKKTRDCLIDGYRSGVAAGVHHTVKMLDVEVEPDEEKKE